MTTHIHVYIDDINLCNGSFMLTDQVAVLKDLGINDSVGTLHGANAIFAFGLRLWRKYGIFHLAWQICVLQNHVWRFSLYILIWKLSYKRLQNLVPIQCSFFLMIRFHIKMILRLCLEKSYSFILSSWWLDVPKLWSYCSVCIFHGQTYRQTHRWTKFTVVIIFQVIMAIFLAVLVSWYLCIRLEDLNTL
jgi:hypothetical protein